MIYETQFMTIYANPARIDGRYSGFMTEKKLNVKWI